ncbi:MAG: TylF/MycF family methyltransferase, partial [Cytophagaceae bacterium]|nr:TylF/MycF family methyltransferase [Cytophagaceae bacterium]
GVFKGASFIRFATFRQFFVNPASKKMIGFDAFGEFPATGFEGDKKMREKFIADSGEQGISVDQLMEVLKHKGVEKNIELVQGDVNMTIPEFVKKYPSLKISLLNIDVDVYEATKTCLEYFYPMVTKGGVVILDDYDVAFPGANKAVDDYFKGKKSQVKRLPFSVTPCYLIKEED